MKYLKRNLTMLLIAILSTILLLYMTYSFPPNHEFTISKFNVSILIPFFAFLFFVFFGFAGYFLKSKLQGVIIGLFFLGFVLLRFYGFTNWFFLLLTGILFVLTEIILLKTK